MQSFKSAKRWLTKIIKILLTYLSYECAIIIIKNKTILRLSLQMLIFLALLGYYVC